MELRVLSYLVPSDCDAVDGALLDPEVLHWLRQRGDRGLLRLALRPQRVPEHAEARHQQVVVRRRGQPLQARQWGIPD